MGAERPGGVNERRDGDAPASEGEAPADVVDFDALHAALGDLPPPPTSSSPMLSESQGRANATYASARPHAIPSTRPPAVLNAPAVIVAPEDTLPASQAVPPSSRKTAPLAGGPGRPARASSPPVASGQLPSLTVPTPHRVKMPTVVVRVRRGPTKQQKLLVFMAMLLVFVSGGLAFLVYGKELGFDVDAGRPASRPPGVTTVSQPPPAVAAPVETATASAAPSIAPSASAVPSASAAPAVSAKKTPRPR